MKLRDIPDEALPAAKQLHLDLHSMLIVDLFAGGGGMSVAMEMAWGRSPDIAINHNENALSMHRMNHPQTRHFISDVFEVCPKGATQGRPVGWLHLSPDCTHHSQASAGQPRDTKIRGLSWVGYRWAAQTAPVCISLENVRQLVQWCPLIAKRDKATGRVLKRVEYVPVGKRKKKPKVKWIVAEKGERVPVQDQYLIPDPKRLGQTWKKFVKSLTDLGYNVETKLIRAANMGGHTSRERLFMLARRDGQKICWQEIKYHKVADADKPRWKPAHECLDFSHPCPSIFERKKPLAANTMKRIAKGIKKFVLDSADPFIVPIAHFNGRDDVHSVREPLRTVVASTKGGEFAVAVPSMVAATHHGGDRVYDLQEPMPTVTAAHRGELMISAPLLAKFRHNSPGSAIDEPVPTITAGGNMERDAGAAHALGLVTPVLIQAGHGEGQPGRAQRWGEGTKDIRDTIGTVTASGSSQAIAAATLVQTGYGERDGQEPRALDLTAPLGTVVAGGVKHAVASATLVGVGGPEYSGKPTSVDAPIGTILADNHRGMATAYLMQANDGFNTMVGRELTEPVTTITNSGSQQQMVTAHLATLRNNCDAGSVDDPLSTVSAQGQHQALVEATLKAEPELESVFISRQFGQSIGNAVTEPVGTVTAGGGGKTALATALMSSLYDDESKSTEGPMASSLSPEDEAGALRVASFLMEYYSNGGQWSDPREPINTLTTKQRMALVTVHIKGVPYVIVDIGLRMLKPRELYNAQDFPPDYIIDRGHDGRKFNVTQQVRMVGNSVDPLMAVDFLRLNGPQMSVKKAA